MPTKETVMEDRKAFVDKILEDIQKGRKLPWSDGILSVRKPRSLIAGKDGRDRVYHGLNSVRLYQSAMMQGFKDSRWCTYKQAMAMGYPVKKGEHGTRIEVWKAFRRPARKDGNEGEKDKTADVPVKPDEFRSENGDTIYLRCVAMPVLFNAEQLKGCPKEPEIVERDPQAKNPYFENMIRNSEASVHHDQAVQNFYTPETDEVHVVPKENFESLSAYYGTVAHEIAHSTGAASRLNRTGITELDHFGTPRYAEEEVCAEMTATFLAKEFDANLKPKEVENHQAYLLSWGKVIKEDPNALFRAIRAAEKATEYIKTRMMERGLEPYQSPSSAIVPDEEQQRKLDSLRAKGEEQQKRGSSWYKKKTEQAKKKERAKSSGR